MFTLISVATIKVVTFLKKFGKEVVRFCQELLEEAYPEPFAPKGAVAV